MSNFEQDLITSADVAEELQMDPRTVQRQARRGLIPSVSKLPGLRGAFVFDRAAIAAYKLSTTSPQVETEAHPNASTGQRDTQRAATSPKSAAEHPNSAAAGPVAPMDSPAYQRLLDEQDARAAAKAARRSA